MSSIMTTPNPASPQTTSSSEIPDRLCTWCQTTMMKRLVGEGRFIHYTCPKCIFQHTSKVQTAASS